MTDLYPTISVIMSNVNGPKTPLKNNSYTGYQIHAICREFTVNIKTQIGLN